MIAKMNRAEFEEFVRKHFAGNEMPNADHVMTLAGRWFERGDGAAIYRNHDLGSQNFGCVQIVSFGSPVAQLETDDPPIRLPDIGGKINWQYQLEATCRC